MKLRLEINKNGDKFYYNNKRQLHREDGPAVEYIDGAKEWYLNDKPHRLDGPAIEYIDGIKEWFIDGKRHREDGPAIEYTDGYKEFYLNDIEIESEEEYWKLVKLKHYW